MQKQASARVAPFALMLAMALVSGACDDVTGPDISAFDPQETVATLDSVLSVLDDEGDFHVLASLKLASRALAAQGGAASYVLSDGHGGLTPSAATLEGLAPAAAGALAVFPSNYLGQTLEWDPASGEDGGYVFSDREGAPTNGVRFLYYAIDPVTERPAEPLVELGYLELTDQSTEASTRIGIKVVNTTNPAAHVTLVDYFIDLALSHDPVAQSATVQWTAEGFISDGEERLDFDLDNAITASEDGSGQVSMDYLFDLPQSDVSVALAVDISVTSEVAPVQLDMVLTVAKGADDVVVDVTFHSDQTVEGTLAYNGATAVVVSGTTQAPEFTRPDGTPLTGEQVEALMTLGRAFDALSALADRIFQPLQDLDA